jgi:hypothetical protein
MLLGRKAKPQRPLRRRERHSVNPRAKLLMPTAHSFRGLGRVLIKCDFGRQIAIYRVIGAVGYAELKRFSCAVTTKREGQRLSRSAGM